MMQVTAQTRILVAVEPADFRKGIDGLCRICRAELSTNPLLGTVFVFRNRRKTAVKILAYDGQGYWLCQKRLSAGKFPHWPGKRGEVKTELLAHQLSVLLAGGDPERAAGVAAWRPITASIAA
jgi:transposase